MVAQALPLYRRRMSQPRTVARSLAIAITTFVVTTAVIVAGWAVAGLAWAFIAIPLLVVAVVCGYVFVLARRGQ